MQCSQKSRRLVAVKSGNGLWSSHFAENDEIDIVQHISIGLEGSVFFSGFHHGVQLLAQISDGVSWQVFPHLLPFVVLK